MIELYDSKENKVVNNRFEGVIKKYSETSKLEYPLIILKCDKIEKYKVEAIKSLLCFDSDEYLNVYLIVKENMLQIGKLERRKLRMLLSTDVLKDFEKEIYVSPDDMLTGDMMYCMCV